MAEHLESRGHEVIFLLNRALATPDEDFAASLARRVPGARVATFRAPWPCFAADPANDWRQAAARVLRELAVAALEPDFVHVSSLLPDGWADDAVASVSDLGPHVPVALIQHDLIPLVMQDLYLPPGHFRDYYLGKVDCVAQADLLLAISDYSRQEVMDLLGVPAGRVVNISSAADRLFFDLRPSATEVERVLTSFGLVPGFLLYVPGGFDPRKNVERLIRAYGTLPPGMRRKHPLVLGSRLDPGRREALEGLAAQAGLGPRELVLSDYVSDEQLVCLYRSCAAYIFPSLHEGFGLPALEAMACGAPVLASSRSSIPEAVGLDEALFDPSDEQQMASRMQKILTDASFRERLRRHGEQQARRFSWERSAALAVAAIEQRHVELLEEGWTRVPKDQLPDCEAALQRLQQRRTSVGPDENDLTAFRACWEANVNPVEP